jgi:hypothetical protein
MPSLFAGIWHRYLTILYRYVTVPVVAILNPCEVYRASCLWRDDDGKPWLLSFELAEIAGRLECVGLNMRSFISHAEEPEGWPAPYPSFWTGGVVNEDLHPFSFLDIIRGDRLERLKREPHPIGRHDPDAVEAGAQNEPDMLLPRPLRAATLRELPLARVLGLVRQQMAGETEERELPRIDLFVDWSKNPGPTPEQAQWFQGEAQTQYELALAAQKDFSGELREPEAKSGGRPRKYTKTQLEMVAQLYRFAYAEGFPGPTKYVATQLGIPRDLAGKLVMRCRRDGLLGPTERRKAGGVDAPEPSGSDAY